MIVPAYKAIFGLGNTGHDYEMTRHNVGQWIFDFINISFPFTWEEKPKLHSAYSSIVPSENIGKTFLIKPLGYMNNSGRSVIDLCSYFRIEHLDVLVIHDDLDLMPGIVKFKFGGGCAGHKGVQNISDFFGHDNFWRLRVGIGHPKNLNLQQSVANFVLSSPSVTDTLKIRRGISFCWENFFNCYGKKIDQVNNLIKIKADL